MALTPGLAAQDPERALDLALELPERVARADGRRLLAVLRRVPGGGLGAPALRRPRCGHQPHAGRLPAHDGGVSYLFAGSIEHVMRDLFAPSRRAFSGFGSFYALRPIDPRGLARAGCASASPPTAARSRRRPRPDRRARRRPPARHDADRPADAPRLARARHARDRPRPRAGRLRARARGRPARRWSRSWSASGCCTSTGCSWRGRSPPTSPLPRRLHPGVRDRVLKLLRDAGILEHESRGRWRVIDPLLRPTWCHSTRFGVAQLRSPDLAARRLRQRRRRSPRCAGTCRAPSRPSRAPGARAPARRRARSRGCSTTTARTTWPRTSSGAATAAASATAGCETSADSTSNGPIR